MIYFGFLGDKLALSHCAGSSADKAAGRRSEEVLIKRTNCPGYRVQSSCRRQRDFMCAGGALSLLLSC